jgi:hypothetical protein
MSEYVRYGLSSEIYNCTGIMSRLGGGSFSVLCYAKEIYIYYGMCVCVTEYVWKHIFF